MKITKYPQLLLALAIVFAGYSASFAGVKIVVTSGNLNFLKTEKTLLTEYKYSDMKVGKFDKEDDYIKKKVAEYNKDKPGSGDKWKESWFNDRDARFEPKFEELLNNYLKKKVTVSETATDAKYKMIVHTVFTEPGFNIAITKKPAIINLEVTFVEIANPDKPVAKVTITGAPGTTYGYGDFDTGVRIAEAYAKAGKDFGGYITKTLSK
jgi:hypothetical protein